MQTVEYVYSIMLGLASVKDESVKLHNAYLIEGEAHNAVKPKDEVGALATAGGKPGIHLVLNMQ